MNYVLMATVILVVGGFGALALFLSKGAFNKLLLSLLEKNDEQRSRGKDEMESGIKLMLENNKQTIDRIVYELREQLKESRREIGDLKGQNMAIKEQLTHTTRATEALSLSTEGLKNLLTNNRLRGAWGEQVAEDLLIGAGFVEKVNYIKQTTTADGRPDFTILLPDGSKLNVDAKFPFDDLIAYQEAKTETDKKRSMDNFASAVKDKVKQITSKDYINPEDQTLDFVIMFIPNEMIFSFIYEKLPKINEYANERKVILAGPFGFTAVLRLVLQAYKNFRYERGLQEILGLIAKFQEEYGKFGDSMEKLGRQIEGAQKVFLEVEGLRSRQLTKVVDKIGEHSSNHDLSNTEPVALEPPKERIEL